MRKILVSALNMLFCLLVILAVLIGDVSHAMAEEIYVYPGESIQTAIDAANDGDEIIVRPGTYVENIDFLGKGITVRSTDVNNDAHVVASTIIDGGGSGTVVNFKNGEGTEAELSGFTVTNSAGDYDNGIHCEDSSPRISNCTISNNMGNGIFCISSSPTISNCLITDNIRDGIHCENSSSPLVTNCTISNNMGSGISCASSSPLVGNCTISDNMAGGIYCGYSSEAIISNSILWNNSPQELSIYENSSIIITYSNIQQESGNYPGEGNINADPLFVAGEQGNYYLRPASPCIDAGTSANAPLEDKEGISRPQGIGIDITILILVILPNYNEVSFSVHGD